MKCRLVKKAFYINLAIYRSFVLLLNAYIFLDVQRADVNNTISDNFQHTFDPTAKTLLWIFVIYFTVREICNHDCQELKMMHMASKSFC